MINEMKMKLINACIIVSLFIIIWFNSIVRFVNLDNYCSFFIEF